MTRGKALVTMAIGEAYQQAFDRLCRPAWTRYADRHGYDLYVLTQPVDDGGARSVHWQKLLVGLLPDLAAYDFVVWLDADVLVNAHAAPCVVSHVDGERIAVARPLANVTSGEPVGERFNIMAVKFDRAVGGTGGTPYYVRKPPPENRLPGVQDGRRSAWSINTGLIVFRPARHKDFLAACYLGNTADAADGSFEQTPLSYALQADDMVEYVDPRFNAVWGEYAAVHYPFLFDFTFVNAHPHVARLCVNTFFHNNWFCHFAGAARHSITKQMIDMVDQDVPHVLAMLDPDLWADRHQVYGDFET